MRMRRHNLHLEKYSFDYSLNKMIHKEFLDNVLKLIIYIYSMNLHEINVRIRAQSKHSIYFVIEESKENMKLLG